MSQYTNTYTASHAVVVGIDEYADPTFAPLGEAEADARAVAGLLRAEPYRFSVRTLFGEKATRAAVLRALGELSAAAQPDDRIVFYFAGHGYKLRNKLGVEVGYLACSDTVPGNPYAGLEFAEVTKLCEWAEAKHIAFILDACFSGKALGLTRGVPAAAAGEYMTRRAWQVLTAGGDEVVADARSMTDILVRALRDGVPGVSGPLTFSDVGRFVKDEMAALTRGVQIPVYQYLAGSSNGEMILPLPPAPTPAVRVVRPAPRRLGTKAAAPAAPTAGPVRTEEPPPAKPVEPPAYDVFISHPPESASLLGGFASSLGIRLKQRGFRVSSGVPPRKSGMSFAAYSQSVAAWSIETAIKNCTVFILIASPAARTSDDVKRAIEYAKRYGKPVIALKEGMLMPSDYDALLSGLRVAHEMYFSGKSMDSDEKFETLVGWLREFIPAA